MARARTIKPAFFASEQVASCSHPARLLFIGLWCIADREGRLQDRPARIRAELFPYESGLDIGQLLSELERAGLIYRYETQGGSAMTIPGFKKHQNPHPKETPSEIIEPFNYTASPVKVEPSNLKVDICPAVSLLPITLSPLKELAPATQDAPPKRKPGRPKKERTDEERVAKEDLKRALMATYQECRGEPYQFSGVKDSTALDRLMPRAAQDEIIRRWKASLLSDDKFHRCNTISTFAMPDHWGFFAPGNVRQQTLTNINAPAGIGTQWGGPPPF